MTNTNTDKLGGSLRLDGASCSASFFVENDEYMSNSMAMKINKNLREIIKDLSYDTVNHQYVKRLGKSTKGHKLFPCDEKSANKLKNNLLEILNRYKVNQFADLG